MSSEADKAVALFEKFNCAQSMFAACAPHEGLSEQMCMAIAEPFGGGMGRMGEVCGAVTGAFMVMGVRNAQEPAADPATARARLYERVNAFAEEFRKRNGSLKCGELTGCDMRTQEGLDQFKSRELKQKLCTGLVRCAVELLEKK